MQRHLLKRDVEVTESFDLRCWQELRHHVYAVFIFRVYDNAAREACSSEKPRDLFAVAMLTIRKASVLPTEIVIQKNQVELLGR